MKQTATVRPQPAERDVVTADYGPVLTVRDGDVATVAVASLPSIPSSQGCLFMLSAAMTLLP